MKLELQSTSFCKNEDGSKILLPELYHGTPTVSRCSLVAWIILTKQKYESLRANIDETESAAIITEQGGQENHRERSQDGSSFCNQFA